MKKTITFLSLVICIIQARSQTTVADFENLTLAADTFYDPHTSTSWHNGNATFRYEWDPSFGGSWGSGFSYTNKNNTVTPTYHNMYASITGKGYANSDKYVTAWAGYGSEKMKIKLASTEKSVSGFFVTNSTYAYHVMKNGGGPARTFGDTLHTSSGLEPGNYPDWFKLTVYGYKNGVKKSDTAEFYLADYRFADNSKDYIVKTWEWVDCSRLGNVDSIFFTLRSSDVGSFGINNPTYFCLDNFSTTNVIITDVSQSSVPAELTAYPNPFSSSLTVKTAHKGATIVIRDLSGKTIYSETLEGEGTQVDLDFLSDGIYFLELNSGEQKINQKLVKSRN